MRIRRMTQLVLFSVAISGSIMLSAAEDNSVGEVEKEVWVLEKAYISAFMDARHEDIISMLHQDFLGWPLSRERPGEKGDVPGFLQENYSKRLEGSVEIDRAGIRVSGDTVITHYLLITTGKDGQVQAIRMTHTWIKEGADWKILGGMSSVQQAKSPGDK